MKSALLYVCKQPVSFAKGTNTLSGPGGFSPWPYKGNCKAVLRHWAEFGQREVLFSNMSSRAGINPFRKGRGHHTSRVQLLNHQSKTKLSITRKSRKLTLKSPMSTYTQRGNPARHLHWSKSISLTLCVQHVKM